MSFKIEKNQWKQVRLDDIVEWYQKDIPNNKQILLDIENYITAEHIESDVIKITRSGLVKSGKKGPTITKHYQKGDLLLSTRSVALRKASITQNEGVTGEKLLVLRPKKNSELIVELFPFIFKSSHFWNFAQNSAAGSVNKFTSWTKIKEYQFLLPPKDQQAKIAKLLWAMDDVVEKEKFIFNSIQIIYKRVLFDFFVGEKIHPKRELGEFVTIKSGESPSKFEYNSENIGIPFLKVKDLNETVKLQEFSKEWVTPLKNRIIPKNSVIFPKRGAAIMTNKVRITICDCHVDTNIMALTITENDKLDTEFLFYFLLYKKLFKIADTSQIPQINNVHINPFPIYLPPIKKQQDLVQELNNFINLMEITEKTVLSSQQLQKSLINEIFSV